jgi:hypothetical protein
MNSTRTAANDSTREEATKNLVSISPFFIVKDLQASIAFYRERLGFQLDFQGPDGDVYYAGVSRDGIGIMLSPVGSGVRRQALHTSYRPCARARRCCWLRGRFGSAAPNMLCDVRSASGR